MAARLSGLDDIDWAKLKHAYGPADDVPDLIRALASNDPKRRSDAEYELYGNIYHQGTRYQATPHAIPFLLELLRDPETPDRGNIVTLLACLAIGFDENFIPDGVDPAKFPAQAHAAVAGMSASERTKLDKYGYGPLVDVACYDAAAPGVPLVLSFLDDPESTLRSAAANFLAWFPEHAPVAVPALEAMLGRAREPLEQAHALLALAMLSRSSTAPPDRGALLQYLDELHPLLVRTAAAVALWGADPEDRVLKVLVEAVAAGEGLNEQAQELRFKIGDLVGIAAMVLREVRGDRERIVAALCRALEDVDTSESERFADLLLGLIAGEKHRRFFEDRQPSQLTSLQRQALSGILDNKRWRTKAGDLPEEVRERLSAYGLPSSRAALRAYLEG